MGRGRKQSIITVGQVLGWSQGIQEKKTGFLSQRDSDKRETHYKLLHEQSSPAELGQLLGSGKSFLAEGRPWFLHPSWVLRAGLKFSTRRRGKRNPALRATPQSAKPQVGQGTECWLCLGTERLAGLERGCKSACNGPCVDARELGFPFNKQ